MKKNNSSIKKTIRSSSKSNNQNDFLSKFSNNRLLLFLVPNLIAFYLLFYYYNQNVDSLISVLFYEIIIGCIIFFLINTLIYLLLRKILKNYQNIFCIMCIISVCYSINMDLLAFLIFFIFIIFITFYFKYLINFSLDNIVGIISFITIILFSFTFITSIYNVSYVTLKSKYYDYTMDFDIDNEKDTPNIYWIHCDAMMSLSTLKEYFNEDYKPLENYFKDNNYYYNYDAQLDTGHSTMRSLVALLNPYYYDNFYGDYLIELEKSFFEDKKNTNFLVNYYELEEKRLNNEFFLALEQKGYETIAISDFNAHISFYADHYYDYYHPLGLGDLKREFRYFKDGDNSELQLNSQIRLIHARDVFSSTILNNIISNMSFLNYDLVDYSDVDLEDYFYTNNTKYWYEKAVFKAIEDSYSEDKSLFTFVDYRLNHYPLTFDYFGNFLQPTQQYELDFYYGNYVYASNLLMEMLNYIKETDKDAVIVVQSDHGINVLEDEFIMQELDINKKELQEVRNSVISAIYVPKKYRNGDEEVLGNPLNISRYLVNNFVGDNYEYIN